MNVFRQDKYLTPRAALTEKFMRLNLWTPVLLSVYRAAPFCGLQPAPALPVGICPSGTLLQCTLCTTTEYSLRISGGSGLPRSPSASDAVLWALPSRGSREEPRKVRKDGVGLWGLLKHHCIRNQLLQQLAGLRQRTGSAGAWRPHCLPA